VSDRIVLTNMVFPGRHGVGDSERASAQPFEVDVEVVRDLAAAGRADDLAVTIDYGEVFRICRSVVEGPSKHLVEALAEEIAARVLALGPQPGADEVIVRVRKPAVPLAGQLDHAGVEIVRRRSGA
jgi:7,8-dihydroneopterin aldolase/epimerase/oxygenase